VTDTSVDSSAVSLASLLTPSYSMGNLKSNSVSSRSSSVIPSAASKAVTRDGLIVSTFHQHHQAYEIRQRTRWHSLLVTLWLMSTKTFIKAGLLEEANKALGEAEQLGLGDPGVWYQLGQLSLRTRDNLMQAQQRGGIEKSIKEMNQVASDSFEKALILDSDHIPSQVAKATRLYEQGQEVLADGLLQHITLGFGWDSAEAWYQQAKMKANAGELDRAKKCFLFALELNDTEPIRNLNILSRLFV
jgi:tetratricopeptide (TPR) repeat protein